MWCITADGIRVLSAVAGRRPPIPPFELRRGGISTQRCGGRRHIPAAPFT